MSPADDRLARATAPDQESCFGDFATWYSPGVAAPCRAIHADPERAWTLTNRSNTIAIVTDGTRVLGHGHPWRDDQRGGPGHARCPVLVVKGPGPAGP